MRRYRPLPPVSARSPGRIQKAVTPPFLSRFLREITPRKWIRLATAATPWSRSTPCHDPFRGTAKRLRPGILKRPAPPSLLGAVVGEIGTEPAVGRRGGQGQVMIGSPDDEAEGTV